MMSGTERTDPEPVAPDIDNRTGIEDSMDGRVIAALGYLPMLFFIPLVAARGSRHAEFHGRQSMVLFLAFTALWVGLWFVSLILGRILGDIVLLGFLFRALGWFLHNVAGGLLSLSYLVAMLFGIVQAASGHRGMIPLIGGYVERYWSS